MLRAQKTVMDAALVTGLEIRQHYASALDGIEDVLPRESWESPGSHVLKHAEWCTGRMTELDKL